MVTHPEELLVLERRLGNGCGIFPIPPLGPVLPKVDAVPQLLGSERTVSEDEIVTALSERGLVIVGIREDHDVVLLALSKEEMIGNLIVQQDDWSELMPDVQQLRDGLPLFQLHLGPVGP